jgi:galactose mutarotase-like enzyme
MIGERTIDGFQATTLSSPEHGIEATFVPDAGMVGCSLTHRGKELLGQRGGLSTYVERRSTMGIPLLHPWANRVGARRFEVAGREVDLDLAQPPPSTDPNGLPIHGLISAAPGWEMDSKSSTPDGGTIAARFDFAEQEALVRAFPFPHRVGMEVTLADSMLTIATTVEATGDATVPISFGFHPYFRLPGVDRADWNVQIPVRERLLLDERMLPTGQREEVEVEPGPLGSRTFDDAYVAPPGDEPLAVAGGGIRIEVAFDSAYPYAQVYAPADDDVIALEPMTAPTNALLTGGSELPLAHPGESYRAAFTVTVSED